MVLSDVKIRNFFFVVNGVDIYWGRLLVILILCLRWGRCKIIVNFIICIFCCYCFNFWFWRSNFFFMFNFLCLILVSSFLEKWCGYWNLIWYSWMNEVYIWYYNDCILLCINCKFYFGREKVDGEWVLDKRKSLLIKIERI